MPRDGRPISAPASANPDGPDAPWPEDVIRTDETGDVDLSVIEYCMSLTPAERLRQAEEFARFVVAIRQANGIPWYGFERS